MGVQYGAGASSVTSAPDLFPRGLAELEQRREFQRMGGTQFLWARSSSRKFPCSSREIGERTAAGSCVSRRARASDAENGTGLRFGSGALGFCLSAPSCRREADATSV